MTRKWVGRLAVLSLVMLVLGLSFLGWARFAGTINARGVDLRNPQGYLATPSLVVLSRDLVKAPVLRELLAKDFAFYYEEHEDRLGLLGAMKRIAFEHDKTLADDLVELALDGPAEVALWPDDRGAVRYWAIAMTRGPVARAVQSVAALASSDRQLTQIGDLRAGGANVAVLGLTLSPRRTLALATRGERVVVFSDPGLLFNDQRQADSAAAAVLGDLLSDKAEAQGLWRRSVGLTRPGAGHTLVARGPLLSFNYQHFFPALEALRIELAPGGTALQTHVRQQGGVAGAPWAALPAQPAACAALPVDWARARAALTDSRRAKDAAPALATVAASFDGPAAICWYAGSQLHTPLLVAHAKGGAPDAKTLARFMRWWLPRQADWSAGKTEALIPAPYGPQRKNDKVYYRAALQRAGDWWLFSPDAALAKKAADTIARRYPSVADTLGDGAANTLLVTAPPRIAELLRREALAVLTPQQATLRQAAETQLFPRLASFGKLPAAQALLSGAPDADGWTLLAWRPLAGAAQ